MKPINLLGPLIERSRTSAGLSCHQVCNRLSELNIKLNPEKLSEIENRRRQLKDSEMFALLQLLSVTPHEIEKAFAEADREL